MSILECTFCGAYAYDNDVTWKMDNAPVTMEIVVWCESCEEDEENVI